MKLSKNYLLESFLFDTIKTKYYDTEEVAAIEQSYEHKIDDLTEYKGSIPAWKQSKCERVASMPDDELFLLINDNHSGNIDECDSNVHVEYRQYYLNKKLDLAIATKVAETTTAATIETKATNKTKMKVQCIKSRPNRKSISRKLEFDALRQNSYNKRLIKYLCTNINQDNRATDNTDKISDHHGDNGDSGARNAIQCEIDQRMIEMHELIKREEQLMKTLSNTCEQYRNQNDKYMSKLRLEMCIDEVQHNLDVYAKEIIEKELKLYQIQNEIHKKCGILYNLRRMVASNQSIDYHRNNTPTTSGDEASHNIQYDFNDDDDDDDDIETDNNIDEIEKCFDMTNNKTFII